MRENNAQESRSEKRFQLILAHRARNIGKVAIPRKNVIGMQISVFVFCLFVLVNFINKLCNLSLS